MSVASDSARSLADLKERIEPKRQALLEHQLYQSIETLDDLKGFMQGHIFAVWDFMSLLKALQQEFCPARVPWTPPSDPLAARLVNEIVLGEETDDTAAGGSASHFQLYRQAMSEAGADLKEIDSFVSCVQQGQSVESSLAQAQVTTYAADFVRQTFSVIQQGDRCGLAAAFTFGREDLLPDVFQRIVDQLNRRSDGQLESFRYYLDRHIELDGDQHGPMAEQLITNLCGTSTENWNRATVAAESALQSRIQLWDAMQAQIQSNAS